jgi:hypothetical protein
LVTDPVSATVLVSLHPQRFPEDQVQESTSVWIDLPLCLVLHDPVPVELPRFPAWCVLVIDLELETDQASARGLALVTAPALAIAQGSVTDQA